MRRIVEMYEKYDFWNFFLGKFQVRIMILMRIWWNRHHAYADREVSYTLGLGLGLQHMYLSYELHQTNLIFLSNELHHTNLKFLSYELHTLYHISYTTHMSYMYQCKRHTVTATVHV